MRKRITVTVSAGLLDRARRKAAAEGRTLASVVEEGLRLVCGKNRVTKARGVMPRISTAGGGLMPGIDLADSAALQEMDDLELIERIKTAR